MAFAACGLLDMGGDWRAPEEIADEVVFADVVGEEIDTWVVVFVASFPFGGAVLGG